MWVTACVVHDVPKGMWFKHGAVRVTARRDRVLLCQVCARALLTKRSGCLTARCASAGLADGSCPCR